MSIRSCTLTFDCVDAQPGWHELASPPFVDETLWRSREPHVTLVLRNCVVQKPLRGVFGPVDGGLAGEAGVSRSRGMQWLSSVLCLGVGPHRAKSCNPKQRGGNSSS